MFTHTSIRTSNLERSIAFYKKCFDLNVLNRISIKETDSQIVFLQDSAGKGCRLELTFYRKQTEFIQAPYETRLFDHLGFKVTDINATINAMRKEGVTITDEPYTLGEDGPTIAFVEDPDGTLIELVQET
ncbi:MAG: VOC family protein [Candidatus Bathyarchaeia archaeon]|jgi:lactoylglutathione lyase